MELLKNGVAFYLLWVIQHLRHRKKCRIDYLARVQKCTFGKSTRIYRDSVVKFTSLGDYSYIGRGSHVQHATIGMYCSIASGVMIGGGKHPTDQASTSPHLVHCWTESVTIGNHVWIGQGAIILDGVKIGDHAVVAAGSVVSHNIKPYTIVGGVPATKIGERKATTNLTGFQYEYANTTL